MTSKALFTVRHKNENIPFVFHMQHGHASIKTAIVAFKTEMHAVHMARLIEVHKTITGDWPDTDFTEEGKKLDFFGKSAPYTMPDISLTELDILEWEENDLVEYCHRHALDALRIDIFAQDDSGDGVPLSTVIKGEFIHLEPTLQYQRMYLENKIKIRSEQ